MPSTWELRVPTGSSVGNVFQPCMWYCGGQWNVFCVGGNSWKLLPVFEWNLISCIVIHCWVWFGFLYFNKSQPRVWLLCPMNSPSESLKLSVPDALWHKPVLSFLARESSTEILCSQSICAPEIYWASTMQELLC